MTKTFRASGREYQRSPTGAPDGALSNGVALARVSSGSGEFVITSEGTRVQLKDTTYNAFSAADHEGRLIYFPMVTGATPPSAGTSGTRLHNGWFFRIKTVVSTSIVELEGFRAEYAGTGISWVMTAAVDFTALSANFPADTGPTGTGADGENRSNTGPCEWQAVSFPEAADGRLKMYPYWVTRRTSSTVLRLSDPFDNLAQFPSPVSLLQWHLRDRPAYTHQQLYKIIHQFFLHCGWSLFQHRGKNNGVGAGGNAQTLIFLADDMIYKSVGEDGKQVGYLRWVAYHKNANNDGTDTTPSFGFDAALFSSWDRAYPSVTVPTGGGASTNQGNGINPLRLNGTSSGSFANNTFAAAADTINNGNNNTNQGYFGQHSAAGNDVAFTGVRWSHPFDPDTPRFIANTLNTPEGGDVQEIRYVMFGSKDEIHIYLEAPGVGFTHLGFGFLKPRPDAQPNNFVTNFSTPNGSNVLLRIGGPGTANGTNPATTTPPYQIGDRIQTVGLRVLPSPSIVPASSYPGELIDSSTITNLPGLVQAIGILICDTVANIVDGSQFTINDGLGNPLSSRVYEFNKTGGITGDIAVDLITGAPTTADQVRDRIRDAVNPLLVPNFTWNGSTTVTSPDTSGVVVNDWIWLTTSNANQLFRITAINPNVDVTIDNPDGFTIPSGSGASTTRRAAHGLRALNTVSARVDLTNGRKGGQGNVLIIDAGAEFLTGTEGMGGGGYAIEIATLLNPIAAGALVGEDPQPIFGFRPSLITTPFSTTGGTQGIFRVSNRSGFADASYRDHNGPVVYNAAGFDTLCELAGMFGPDAREINPNERSGRFSLVTLSVRDTVGGQIRGSMRLGRIVSPRVGCYGLRRDRNGDWHMLIPFQGRFVNFTETTSNELIFALGPMPSAMAFVG